MKNFDIIILSKRNVFKFKKQYHVEGLFMAKREVVYMVTYQDDRNQKHITFVKGFSAVRFLEERFGRVEYEITECYARCEAEVWY